MIDFLKILVLDIGVITDLYNNDLLLDYSMYQKLNDTTHSNHIERQNARHTKIYKGVYFCFYDNKLEILLKPHYYFNNNKHNANDFNIIDCIKTLNDFANLFNLPIKELKTINIEYGINAISPIDCKDLIAYLIYHEKNEFITTNECLKHSKFSSKFNKYGRANNYKKIKFYAKGVQYPEYTDINTFRFEVHSKRSKYINSLGVFNYSDLLNFETYQTLSENLLTEFKNVLILDIDNKGNNLSSKELIKFNEYNNPIKWNKTLHKHRNTFNNHKKRYFNLLDKTDNNIHKKLETIITDKLNLLLKGCAISTPSMELKTCAFSYSNIIENCTNKISKECSVTGYDISMQKSNSKLLSHTGIRYYLKHNYKLYKEIERVYLSSYWNNSSNEIKIKEIAHNIRNKYYNNTFNPNQLRLNVVS